MEIKGLKELLKNFGNLKELNTSKSLLKGAYTLQKYSMENSPVKTGFLRQSHESIETGEGAEMHVNANYAYYQEFGTEKMPERGFVRKSIDEHSEEIVNVVGQDIENEIKGKIT